MPEFADAPMRVSGLRRRSRAQPAAVAAQALTALKAFLHDQVCDLEALRARHAPQMQSDALLATPGLRYRHPLRDLGWDGRGRQPQWLRDALLSEGWLLVDLRLAAQPITSGQSV